MKHIVDIDYYFEETGTTEKNKNGQESYIPCRKNFLSAPWLVFPVKISS
jgi:hypothetical protein